MSGEIQAVGMERRDAEARIRERLVSSLPPPSLEFAVAVVLHLTFSPAEDLAEPDERAVERDVAALLAAVERGPGGAGEGAVRLHASPELLASVFQNVDLLYAAGYPHADRLSLLVMESIARGERGEAEKSSGGGGA